MFLQRVDPCLDDFEDEQAVFGDQPAIDDLAFQIGIALVDQRSLDARCDYGGERELPEFVDLAARAVADADHLFRQRHCRDVDHAFLG